MTLDDALDVEVLPGQCGQLGKCFLEAARLIVQTSMPLVAGPRNLRSEYLLLRSGRVRLRLYLSKQADRVVLFFFKEDGLEDVLLDASVDFTVGALRERNPRPALSPEAVEFRVRTPACFLPEITAQQRQDLLNRLEADVADVLFIRFEQGAIAVNTKTRRIFWPMNDAILAPDNPAYLWPLLAIARNLGFWIGDEVGAENESPLDPQALAGASDFDSLQRQLTKAWCRVVNDVERRETPDTQEAGSGLERLAATLTPDFGISSYRTSLTMRLDRQGNVAFRDEDDLFQLIASIDYQEEEHATVAHLELKPPDLLLSGAVHKALLDQLAEDDSVDRIAKALKPLLASSAVQGGLAPGTTDRQIIQSFLESAKAKGPSNTALVFRIKRGHRMLNSPDTDILVLTGQFGGISPVHVVVKAKVRVTRGDTPEDVRAEILSDDFDILACSHQAMAQKLEEVTDYFARLFTCLNVWFRVAVT